MSRTCERVGMTNKSIILIFDSMVFDRLYADKPALALTVSAIRSGLVRVATTHVQKDQISAIGQGHLWYKKELEKLWSDLEVQSIGASPFIVGHSKLGKTNLGSSEADAFYVEFMSAYHSDRHLGDAIIGASAIAEGYTLVTDDKRFAKRASGLGAKVVLWQTFSTWLTNVVDEAQTPDAI